MAVLSRDDVDNNADSIPPVYIDLERLLLEFRDGKCSITAVLEEIDRLVTGGYCTSDDVERTFDGVSIPLPLREVLTKRSRAQGPSENKNQSKSAALKTNVPNGSEPARSNAQGPIGEGSVLESRYELLKCVGAGGSSTVYKALDRRRLRHDNASPYIAVKVLNHKLKDRPDWLERLQAEAAKSEQLRHPNIVQVYEFQRTRHTVFITMEYLAGEPLTQRIRVKDFAGLRLDEAMAIVNAMASALDYAHQQGVVHCDFKPANVFITAAGDIKLIDFGIAQTFSADSNVEMPSDPTADIPKAAWSLAYASPDLLQNKKPDPRDDIYSLAATAYELLTGRHPFGHRSALAARAQKLSVPRAGLTWRQWGTLRNALAFDREQRTPSVAEFVEGLNGQGWQQHAGTAAAIGLLAVGATLFGYGIYRQQTQPSEVPADQPLEQVLELSPFDPPFVTPETVTTLPDSPPPLTVLSPKDAIAGEPGSAWGAPTFLAAAAQSTTNDPRLALSFHPDKAPGVTPPRVSLSQETLPAAATVGSAEPARPARIDPRITRLLETAERHMAADRLMLPKKRSAYAAYQEILTLAPDHEAALAGLQRLKAVYAGRAAAAEQRGDWAQAEQMAANGLKVDPQDDTLRLQVERYRSNRSGRQPVSASNKPESRTQEKEEPLGAATAAQPPATTGNPPASTNPGTASTALPARPEPNRAGSTPATTRPASAPPSFRSLAPTPIAPAKRTANRQPAAGGTAPSAAVTTATPTAKNIQEKGAEPAPSPTTAPESPAEDKPATNLNFGTF